MQEKNKTQESLADQTLKRFRTPESMQRTEKRKKFSTGLIIINLVVITLLYVIFSGRKPGEEYRSSSFNYQQLNFRFSMAREKGTKSYVFSLSTRITGNRDTVIQFNQSMADLIVSYGSIRIVKKTLGRNISSLILKPNETDIQRTTIDHYELQMFADGHPEHVVSPRRSLIQFEKAYIRLLAEVRIRTYHPLSTSLTFRYEVE